MRVETVSNTNFVASSHIECFYSRGHYLCKFIGTKESVCIRKEFNSQRISLGLNTNMAAVSLFWDTDMAAVTSCENTLLRGKGLASG